MQNLDKLQFQHQALQEISSFILDGLKGDQLYHAVLRAISGTFGASSAALVCYLDGKEKVTSVGSSFQGEDSDLAKLLKRYNDFNDTGRLSECGVSGEARKGVFTKLTAGNERLGLLCIGPKFSKRVYDKSDLELLKIAGNEISLILILERKLEQEKQSSFDLRLHSLKLETLHEISIAIGMLAKPDEIVDKLLMHLIGIIDVRAAFVVLLKGKNLKLVGEFGLNVPAANLLKAKSVLKAMRSSNTVRVSARNNVFTNYDHSEALLVPLISQGEHVGLLGLVDRETRKGLQSFSETDVNLVESIASITSVAIHNGYLYADLLDQKLFNDSILYSIPASVITADYRKRISFYNREAEHKLGFEKHHLSNLWDKVIKGIRCKRGTFEHNEEIEVPKGKIYANTAIASFSTHTKKKPGTIISIEDITAEFQVRDTFKKYVSESVVDMLLQNMDNLALGGAECEVTVLFSDLRGFTSMSERMSPTDAVSTLNEYFNVMVNIILSCNGTIDKFVGDEIMAVFGAPIQSKDDTDRAFKCARMMLEAMEDVNRLLAVKGLEPLYQGIGVNSGTALSGNIGSSNYMDYTVIGDPVNAGSRICDEAERGELLLSAETYKRLTDTTGLVWHEPLSVKGKTEPIQVYSWKCKE